METDQKTLLQFLDKRPPALIRVMAVNAGKGKKPVLKSLKAIQADSGLSLRLIQRLVFLKSWQGVKVGVASKFISGCGVDILHNHCPSGGKVMTTYYFFRNYIAKGLTHLTDRQRKRFYEIMEWSE